uniref:Genome polyprotein n=1 Tax=Riboviria sp. TaxID=2585031 RepID=A0A6M9Z7H8_9VIRU|nr:MAG: hypothetical protein [Riboviria sp.]
MDNSNKTNQNNPTCQSASEESFITIAPYSTVPENPLVEAQTSENQTNGYTNESELWKKFLEEPSVVDNPDHCVIDMSHLDLPLTRNERRKAHNKVRELYDDEKRRCGLEPGNYFCSVCYKQTNGLHNYTQHLNSPCHATALRFSLTDVSCRVEEDDQVFWYCNLCHIKTTSVDGLKNHFGGKQHSIAVKAVQKMYGTPQSGHALVVVDLKNFQEAFQTKKVILCNRCNVCHLTKYDHTCYGEVTPPLAVVQSQNDVEAVLDMQKELSLLQRVVDDAIALDPLNWVTNKEYRKQVISSLSKLPTFEDSKKLSKTAKLINVLQTARLLSEGTHSHNWPTSQLMVTALMTVFRSSDEVRRNLLLTVPVVKPQHDTTNVTEEVKDMFAPPPEVWIDTFIETPDEPTYNYMVDNWQRGSFARARATVIHGQDWMWKALKSDYLAYSHVFLNHINTSHLSPPARSAIMRIFVRSFGLSTHDVVSSYYQPHHVVDADLDSCVRQLVIGRIRSGSFYMAYEEHVDGLIAANELTAAGGLAMYGPNILPCFLAPRLRLPGELFGPERYWSQLRDVPDEDPALAIFGPTYDSDDEVPELLGDVVDHLPTVHSQGPLPIVFPQGSDDIAAEAPEVVATGVGAVLTAVESEERTSVPPSRVDNVTAAPNAEFASLLAKPLLHANVSWDSNAVRGATLVRHLIPGDFLNDANNAHLRILEMFAAVKMDCEINVKVNGNFALQGALGVVALPMDGETARYFLANPMPIIDATQCMVDPMPMMACETKSYTYRIPFLYPHDYMTTTDTTTPITRAFGGFAIYVMSPLIAVEGASTSINLTVTVSFPNATLIQPMSDQQVSFPKFLGSYSAHSDVELPVVIPQGFNLDGVIGSVGDVISGGLSVVGGVTSIASTIGGFFGLDKPTAVVNPDKVELTSSTGWQHSNVKDNSERISMYAGSVTELPNNQPFKEYSCDLLDLCKRKVCIGSFKWKKSYPAGTELCMLGVGPQMFPESVDGARPFISHLARLFQFWQGGIKYTLVPVCTPRQTGLLQLAHVPFLQWGGDVGLAARKAMNYNVKHYELNNSGPMELECDQINVTGIQQTSDAYSKEQESFLNGYFQVNVMNELSCPAGMAEEVDVLVFMEAMDNFSLNTFLGEDSPVLYSEPMEQPITPIVYPQSSPETIPLVDPDVYVGEDQFHLPALIRRVAWQGARRLFPVEEAQAWPKARVNRVGDQAMLFTYLDAVLAPTSEDFSKSVLRSPHSLTSLFAYGRGSIRYKISMSNGDNAVVSWIPFQGENHLNSTPGVGQVFYNPKVSPHVSFEIPWMCREYMRGMTYYPITNYELSVSQSDPREYNCAQIFQSAGDDYIPFVPLSVPPTKLSHPVFSKWTTNYSRGLRVFPLRQPRVGYSDFRFLNEESNSHSVPTADNVLLSELPIVYPQADQEPILRQRLTTTTCSVFPPMLNNPAAIVASVASTANGAIQNAAASVGSSIVDGAAATLEEKFINFMSEHDGGPLSCGMELTNLVLHAGRVLSSESITEFFTNLFHAVVGTAPGKIMAYYLQDVLSQILNLFSSDGHNQVHNGPELRTQGLSSAEPLLNILVPVVGLLFCGQAISTCKSSSIVTQLLSSVANAGRFANAIMGIDRFIPWFGELWTAMKEYIPFMSSKTEMISQGEMGARVHDALQEIQALDKMLNGQDVLLTKALCDRIFFAHDAMTQCQLDLTKTPCPRLVPFVTTGMTIIRSYAKEALAVSTYTDVRYDPFGVCFTGAPGVGKSAICNRLISDISHVRKFPNFNRTYARCGTDKFWSKYTGQRFVMIDDFCATNPDATVSEMITIKSNVALSLNMAELTDKGRFFTSEYLILTTNTPYPNPTEILCKDALWRRRNVLVQTTVHPACALPNGMVDVSKVDNDNFTHLQFQLLDPIRPGRTMSGLIPYADFLRYVLDLEDRHRAAQTVLIEQSHTVSTCAKTLAASSTELPKIKTQGLDDDEDEIPEFYDGLDIPISEPLLENQGGSSTKISPPAPEGLTTVMDSHHRGDAAKRLFNPARPDAYEVQYGLELAPDYSWRVWVPQGLIDFHETQMDILDYDTKSYDDRFRYFRDLPGVFTMFAHGKAPDVNTAPRLVRAKCVKPALVPRLMDKFTTCLQTIKDSAVEVAKQPIVKYFAWFCAIVAPVILGMYVWKRSMPKVSHQNSSAYSDPGSKHRPVPLVMVQSDQKTVDLANNVASKYHTVMFIHDEVTGSLRHSQAFRLKGSTLMVNKHYFENCDRTKIAIGMLVNNKIVCMRLDDKNYLEHPDKDLALIRLNLKFQTAPNNVRHFIRERDLGKIMKPKCVLISSRPNSPVQQYSFTLNGRVDVQRENGEVYRQVYEYVAPTVSGDCTGILIADEKHIQERFLGIHCAAAGGKGYSVALTQELLYAMDKQLDDATGVMNISNAEIPMGILTGEEPTLQLQGSFDIIGQVQKQFRPGHSDKTDFIPSPIAGEAFPVSSRPPLTKKERRELGLPNGYIADCEAYGRLVDEFPPEIREIACNDVNDIIRTKVKPIRPPQLLSWKEAALGIPELPYFDRLNMASSAGWPLNLEKGSHGKHTFIDEEGNFRDDLMADCEERERMAQQGERKFSVWTTCEKDQRIPYEKAMLGKTRVFTIGNLAFTLLMRRYFLDFAAAFYNSKLDFFSAVGIDTTGPEWSKLWLKMRANYLSFAGDYGKFDKSQSPFLLWVICTMINAWYDDGPVNARVRYTIFHEIIQTITITDDCLYITLQGNPSGNTFTVIINSIINAIYLRAAWMLLALRYAPEQATMRAYNTHVLETIYGDDNGVSVTSDVPWFNLQTVSALFAEFGIEYGSATKDGTTYHYLPTDQITFLKQGQRQDPANENMIHNLMDKRTIHELTNWVRRSNDNEAMCKDNLEDACRFHYHYGREEYETFVGKVHYACDQAGLDFYAPSYLDLDLEWRRKFGYGVAAVSSSLEDYLCDPSL